MRPIIRPNIHTQAIGMMISETIWKQLVQKSAFSSGWVELGPKKPPPFVPSCLIATKAAAGPRAMVCTAPSSVVTVAAPSKLIGTPRRAMKQATIIARGSRTQNDARWRSRKKLPMLACPPMPRAKAASAAMPVAAETNCSHISPPSWAR